MTNKRTFLLYSFYIFIPTLFIVKKERELNILNSIDDRDRKRQFWTYHSSDTVYIPVDKRERERVRERKRQFLVSIIRDNLY